MTAPDPKNKPQDFALVALRSLLGRCPNCGRGPLFASYLRQVEYCACCGEQLGHIRADDGPAWLTILLVGHILAPLLLVVIPNTSWPDWMSVTVWSGLALVLTLSILPRAKGLFIALIWRAGGVGSEK
jgi:uncharacterized protein (DUF983 family)